MIFEQKFVTSILILTYALLVLAGHFFLLFLITALILSMYFTTVIQQLKSERTFQDSISKELSEIKKAVYESKIDSEHARNQVTDLTAKFGFKSLTK